MDGTFVVNLDSRVGLKSSWIKTSVNDSVFLLKALGGRGEKSSTRKKKKHSVFTALHSSSGTVMEH